VFAFFGPGPHLGITTRDLGASEAEREKEGGAVVEEVRPGSPAERAGLKKGDVIVQFDGERVRSARHLSRLVEETSPGRTVKSTVVREGRRMDLTVVPSLDRRPQVSVNTDRIRRDAEILASRVPREFDFDFDGLGSGRRLGVSVIELTPQLAAYFGVQTGVLVESVDDESAAARAGIRTGDVIASVNGEGVKSRRDLVRALRQANDDDVTIGLVREKKDVSLRAKLEPRARALHRT
jgi:serine protease Do